jgi:hypothetical protein
MSIQKISLTVSPYILAVCLSSPGWAKGLDTLQAGSNQAPAANAPLPGGAPTPASDSVPAGGTAIQPAIQTVPPGTSVAVSDVDRMYLASSFSWINLSGSKGDWVTGTTADIEAGYRFLTVLQKFDLFGTFRYRPTEALVKQDNREYRAIVETYLFGAKGRMALNSKIAVNASAELGMSQTHLNSNDSLPSIDQSLEKSGVDLNLGGGVSYLVLEKFAVGGKLTLGTGAYKSVQLGVDLRFML